MLADEEVAGADARLLRHEQDLALWNAFHGYPGATRRCSGCSPPTRRRATRRSRPHSAWRSARSSPRAARAPASGARHLRSYGRLKPPAGSWNCCVAVTNPTARTRAGLPRRERSHLARLVVDARRHLCARAVVHERDAARRVSLWRTHPRRHRAARTCRSSATIRSTSAVLGPRTGRLPSARSSSMRTTSAQTMKVRCLIGRESRSNGDLVSLRGGRRRLTQGG